MTEYEQYIPVGWANAPDKKTTPTSAQNFNHMDSGIQKNRTYIVELGAACDKIFNTVDEVKLVSALPSDASQHPTTLYLLG